MPRVSPGTTRRRRSLPARPPRPIARAPSGKYTLSCVAGSERKRTCGIRRGQFVAGALAFAVSTSCGTNNSNTCEVPEDNYASAYAASICDHAEPCCRAANIPFNAVECTRNMTAGALLGTFNMAKFGVTYDCNAARQCVAALAKAVASCQKF